MTANRRKAARRAIGYNAKIVALDGSWGRDCRVIDVSDTGAKIAVDQRAQERSAA
ncbi:MAG: hypothetical protein QOF14_3855 [Hyphomicrobiales bacterium]|nr:hypothetical protein [Hyphomicrobiales bacterium]